jgi:hypothetical protein
MGDYDTVVLYKSDKSEFRVRCELDQILGTTFTFTITTPDVAFGVPIEVSTKIRDKEAKNLAEFILARVPYAQHKFDPGGRAHWEKPRCKECQEFKDHPIHTQPEPYFYPPGPGI